MFDHTQYAKSIFTHYFGLTVPNADEDTTAEVENAIDSIISAAVSKAVAKMEAKLAAQAEKRPSAIEHLNRWRKEYQVNVFANPNGIAVEIYDRAGNVIARGRDDHDIETAFNRAANILPTVAPADWIPGLVGSTPADDGDMPF